MKPLVLPQEQLKILQHLPPVIRQTICTFFKCGDLANYLLDTTPLIVRFDGEDPPSFSDLSDREPKLNTSEQVCIQQSVQSLSRKQQQSLKTIIDSRYELHRAKESLRAMRDRDDDRIDCLTDDYFIDARFSVKEAFMFTSLPKIIRMRICKIFNLIPEEDSNADENLPDSSKEEKKRG